MNSDPIVLDNVMSVKATAKYSGYSSQYLRRMLREGRLFGLKVGQVWLINKISLDNYLMKAILSKDQRYYPKYKK